MIFHKGTFHAGIAACGLSLFGAAGCQSSLRGKSSPEFTAAQSYPSHEPGWRDLSLFPPKPPVVLWERYPNKEVFISAHEGWSSHTAGRLLGSGLEVAMPFFEKETGIPAAVAAVHFWEDNMPSIREANSQGRKIVVVGYSAGGDQAMRVIERCDREGIFVDLVVFLDPVFTSKVPLPIFTTIPPRPFEFPRNVGKVAVFMSGGSLLDPIRLGRGSEEVINAAARNDSRIKPPIVLHEETHFSLGLPRVVVPLMKNLIAEMAASQAEP